MKQAIEKTLRQVKNLTFLITYKGIVIMKMLVEN